ncbi:MAG: hypothetical protein NTZ95_06140 [Candidatus Omnitrophica bacterium]|nr:hypothetical protein [Candidatus Omnitrophota bacterium]
MFSEPVVGDRFFGREEVLDLFNKRVAALKDGYRQNIALTGQSLSGKSSIILHFLSTIKGEGFVPIYVEVVKESFGAFADKFVATMLYNAISADGEKAPVELEELLDISKNKFPKTYSAVKGVYSLIENDEIDGAYTGLLTLTSVLKEESGLPSIVILDEFDNLEHIGVRNPFLNFGKVIMVQKDTMYVVSSSRSEAIKKIISEKLSLLFGNFEVIRISNFDERKAAEYIDVKLPGYDIEPGVRRFVIDLTDGNPFYLDKITSEAGNIARENMTSYIGEDVAAQAILRLVYDSGGAIHQYLTSFILDLLDSRLRDTYMSALIAISNGKNKQADVARAIKKKRVDTSKILVRLTEQGIISGSGVFYRIDDRLFAFWLKNVYDRRRKILIDGAFDRAELFANDIRSEITSFAAESSKSPTERVSELFNTFSNELVGIDSKQLRMPHFTRVDIKHFADSSDFVSASFRGSHWIAKVYEKPVSENDIIAYVKNVKSLDVKVSLRIIIALEGIDDNSRLLAKELRIAVWDAAAINLLLGLYDKKRLISI